MGQNIPLLLYGDALSDIAAAHDLGPRLADAVWQAQGRRDALVNAELEVGAFHPAILIGEAVSSMFRRLVLVGQNWQLPLTHQSLDRLAARGQLGVLDQAIADAERELSWLKGVRARYAEQEAS